MLMTTTNGWKINGALTTIQIVFLTLFIVFVVSLIIISVGFYLYRQQLKRIKKIDSNLEILYRYPLEEAINRFAKINERNNHEFDQLYKLIRIKYLTVLEETFDVAAKHFLTGLENHELTKINYKAIMKLKMIDQAVDKAKIEFDTLSTLLNDFFSYEYELRDITIDLKKQVNLIKTNYETEQKQLQYPFPETVFEEYLGYIHKFVNLIHNYLVLGDYQSAFEKLAKILTWTLKVNEEVVVYPKIRSFLVEQLPEEINQIERDWASESMTLTRTKNRFKFLKERTFNESKVAFDAIQNLDFKRAQFAIEKIQQEIYDFKSELAYEEEIKSFFKINGHEIDKTMVIILNWINQLVEQNSPTFKENAKAIYEGLTKPVQRIQRNLTKVNNVSERDLETIKKQFHLDLDKIVKNIYLLDVIKTNNSLLEQDFLNYLEVSFEIKANLIVISNILKDGATWLDAEQFKIYNQDYFELYHQLVKEDVNNIDAFAAKCFDQVQKDSFFNRLNNIKVYSYKLKATLVYDYQLYYLATALEPLLEFGQNEGKINYVYQEMQKAINQKNYEQAINQFVNNINAVYYQL